MGGFSVLQMNVLSSFFIYRIQRIPVVWGCQESHIPPAYQVKQSAKWIIWGGMTGSRTGRGFTNLYFVPQGQTLTANYYINKILNEEVKPLISR